MTTGQPGIHTFLIADIRGYSRYTDEFGAEAAAGLTARFVELVTEDVETHGGDVVEIRGDEALAVFTSARQAIRCAIALQARFDEEAAIDHDLPLRVGIGLDSGEAVALENGGFRGAALNVAARLCARAHGGEVIVTDATYRLAGRMEGLTFSDRGRVHLKNISDPIHILQVYREQDAPNANRWVLMFFGKPARQFGWKLAAGVAGLAALTAAGVVYLTTGDNTEGGSAAAPVQGPAALPGTATLPASARLDALVPAALWKDCRVQSVANPSAIQTAVCLPSSGTPDRWEISMYPNASTLASAYSSQLGPREDIPRDKGKCNAFSWGGEHAWLHGPDKPGGRVFCYFDGNDAVIVWTHERLGQPTHRDILVVAREGGSDHAGLTRWWRPWHHQLGKAG
ncbi:MAG TPA: adenylate/guanylate cyclase domain-containing protein [Gaiella sp.]|jgi:class 3 adenylate cyclase